MEKRYGLPTAISMVVGIVIGSGVFIKGGKVLSLTGGNLLQGIAVVGIVGLICIICSLVFAELGSRYEKVNGIVDYAEVALGPKYAYYVGWFTTVIYTPAIVAMLAFFSAMMFLQLFGISAIDFATGQVNPVAIGVGAGFMMIDYGINALSPKIAGKLQVGMTVIKLVPLLLMGIVGTIAGLVNGTTLEVLNYVNTPEYTPFITSFKGDPSMLDTFAANNATLLVSISQVAEALCILLIPYFLKRYGIKVVMLIAMFAWVFRFGFFGLGNPAFPGVTLFILSCIVYGVAFDFFNVSGGLFVDQKCEPKVRASAQSGE